MPFKNTVQTRFDNMHEIYKKMAIFAAKNGLFDILKCLVKNNLRDNAYYNLLSQLGNEESELSIEYEILNFFYDKLKLVAEQEFTEELKKGISDDLSSLVISKMEDFKDALSHIKFEILERSLRKAPLTAKRKSILEDKMRRTCDSIYGQCDNYMTAILKDQYRPVEVLDMIKKELSTIEVKLRKTKIRKSQVSDEVATREADLQQEQLNTIKKYFPISNMSLGDANSETIIDIDVPEIFIKVIGAKTIQELEEVGWHIDLQDSPSVEVEKINALRELLCINSPAVSINTVEGNLDLLAISLQTKSMPHQLTTAFLLLYGSDAGDEYYDRDVLKTSYSVLQESKFLLNFFKRLKEFGSEISKNSAENVLNAYIEIEKKFKLQVEKLRSEGYEKLPANRLHEDFNNLQKHVNDLLRKQKAKQSPQESATIFKTIWRQCKEKYREASWYGYDDKFVEHISEVTKSSALLPNYHSVHKKLKKIIEKFKEDTKYGSHNNDLTSSPIQMPGIIQQRITEIARIEANKAVSNLEKRVAQLELKHLETQESVSELKRSQEIQETRLAKMQHEAEQRILKLQEEIQEKSEERILKLQENLTKESEQAHKESEERMMNMQQSSEKRLFSALENSENKFFQLMSRMIDLNVSTQTMHDSQTENIEKNGGNNYQTSRQPFYQHDILNTEKANKLNSIKEETFLDRQV